jgi:hypothetical protein
LDVAGTDATEAFEDVGHSVDALTIMEGLVIGTLDKKVRYIDIATVAFPKFLSTILI